MRHGRMMVGAGILGVLAGCSDSTDPAPVDRTPPQVSITSPLAGAVTGTVTLTANATDDIGVTVVEWKINTALLPAPDSAAPFQHQWDTSANGPGIYEWVAVAKDAAGKSTESAPVTYTVAP
ncbi:MAG TPA: Ig-like domain-containing protein [Gemmatimonadales bacterium]|nr:Ig-like domain-containing protein [Gemmatimonadales bacterium]